MIEKLFEKQYSSNPSISGFTPGRVNLIGEHTDYNGGMVLPTALKLGVTIALSPRKDGKIQITSDKFDETALRTIHDASSGHWSDYIVGAVQEAITQGYLENGADIAVSTTLPFGAGISSSAAVTVGVLKLTRDLSGANITDTQIAIQARHVENEFIGMPCGIMDQMAVAIAHEGQALALDTDSLRYSLIDLPTDYHMAVVHSGQFRQLNEGRYKERKEECDKIKAFLGTDDICQISDSALQSLSSLSDRLQKRAKHCATEHRRTISAIEAIKSNEIAKLGQLMSQSHSSMRDDFDITLPKVDALVEDAVKFGALGARQTGGGFGGCIVACVPKKNVTKWSEKLLSYHSEAFWVC